MPPRIPRQHCTLKAPAAGRSSSRSAASSSQCLARRRQTLSPQPSSRSFSSSTPDCTRLRREMYKWLDGPGSMLREPKPGSTNYLMALKPMDQSQARAPEAQDVDEGEEDGDLKDEGKKSSDARGSRDRGPPKQTRRDSQPFPMNPEFISQPVLSEALREEIWRRVVVQEKPVKVVSAEMSVEMNRVGAVVRLKAIEKDWQKQGKPLITPYNKAILAMLPQTPYSGGRASRHESINDLPAHPATMEQLFVPTSESRAFTRVDAARAFSDDLLPADDRIPHPELIELEREKNQGFSRDERIERQRQRGIAEREERARQDEARQKREARLVKKIAPTEEGGQGGRWEWRFREVRVDRDTVGLDGRGARGVGTRYGFPHEDRKKGQVKIPTKVG